MKFFQLTNIIMPTIVGILIFMSRKDFMLNCVEHEKTSITSGPVFIFGGKETISQNTKGENKKYYIIIVMKYFIILYS